MIGVYEDEKYDFEKFWSWWLNLEEYALKVAATGKDGTKSLSLQNHMMIAAFAAVKWEKHKDKWIDAIHERIHLEKIEKLQAQLREKGRELSKLKARLKRQKGSKAKAKAVKHEDA